MISTGLLLLLPPSGIIFVLSSWYKNGQLESPSCVRDIHVCGGAECLFVLVVLAFSQQ